MKYNMLSALAAFSKKPSALLVEGDGIVVNRANAVGESLEDFVKKMLAQRLDVGESLSDLEHYEAVFSYLGNANNPPDMILKGGDAIEVKKVESKNARLALNSSYPKNKLYSSDSKITNKCRSSEDWQIKDMFYVVGNVPKGKTNIKHLWLVQGDCFAAEKNVYERIAETITNGINSITEIEVDSNTNELSGVKKVDPLGITNLRVRGMWGVDNPSKVFSYVYAFPEVSKFSLACIMLKEKFEDLSFEGLDLSELEITDVKVKNPNNPVDLLAAKLITFVMK